MRIIIDTLGADESPIELAKGALLALDSDLDLDLLLIGPKEELESLVKDSKYQKRVSILEAVEVITNDDQPTTAIKTKKDSSMVKGLQLLKDDCNYDALISAGNTGALLFGSMLIVGRIAGLERAALAPLLPTFIPNKYVCLIDSGANVDCKPELLKQFALMGVAYQKSFGKISDPQVALVSVGTENKKGNEQTKATFKLLEELPINFVGNMEAREALSGNYDVLVCDGFIGNVLLKSIEGTAKMVLKMLGAILTKNLPKETDATFIKRSFKEMMTLLDFNSNGGAALLGINKTVIKIHGSANAETVKSAIFQAKEMVLRNSVNDLKNLLKKVVC